LLVLSVLSILAGLPAAETAAAEQPVAGGKLFLKAPKLLLLSRDAAIHVGGAAPGCPSGGSALVLDDGTNTATFLLPCDGWRTTGSGTLKYRNPQAPNGESSVKAVWVRNGLLKVVGRSLGGMPVPNGNATIAATLHLDGAAERYCMTFTGTGDGSRFLVKNAPAASCSSPPPCEATTGGHCWFLGVDDASCELACAIEGRAYDSATESYAGSGGSDANCDAVLDALGVPAGPLMTSSSCFDGVGCFYAPPAVRARCASPPTNATSAQAQRACACQ
jgi:hypothetical protein